MRPTYRKAVSKRKSARKFRQQVSRTRVLNLAGLARGGIRL